MTGLSGWTLALQAINFLVLAWLLQRLLYRPLVRVIAERKRQADKGLSRLMEILKETGQWDNTLIIFISDNGIAFPGAKTNLYEPGMRLPCVVRSPYQKNKGHACDAMVNWTYITPTILDFCNAMPKDHEFHGRSFLNTLEEEHPDSLV